MAKRMRATAIMPKDSLAQKQKAPVTTIQALTEQDQETTSRLVFKIKRKATATLTEHSHLDGRAPSQHAALSEGRAPTLDVVVIQEGEAESYRGKSLWDPILFNISYRNSHLTEL